MAKPIFLSPPHIDEYGQQFVLESIKDNWITPVGPNIDVFEKQFSTIIGSPHVTAVSSGTASLHLALRLLGVESGDEVFCSTLTFVASVNPIVYLGAQPVFIDSDRATWNMDPHLLEKALQKKARLGKLPKAVIVVHLYGQSADLEPILNICNYYGIPVIEDAAEALGATYKGKAVGTFGKLGIFSFNSNKIITTSGGGMLVSEDERLIRKGHFLASQAKEPVDYYSHKEVGYNYRFSNVLAGIGRGQLLVLSERIAARRENFEHYQQTLGQIPSINFMPEAQFGKATRWLSVFTVNPKLTQVTTEKILQGLASQDIEGRKVWKPMHLQPLFADCECFGGAVAEDFFDHGLCLPSGSNLTYDDRQRIIDVIKQIFSEEQTS